MPVYLFVLIYKYCAASSLSFTNIYWLTLSRDGDVAVNETGKILAYSVEKRQTNDIKW